MADLSGKVLREVLRFPAFTPLENWDMSPREVRRPTRLFPLTPIGIGTPMVEGLASYLASLAAEHSVSVRNLIRDELLPLTASACLGRRAKVKEFGYWKCISGMEDITSEVVSALEIATELKSFQDLTMLRLAGFVSPEVVSAQRKWCPYCPGEFQTKGRVYEPLVWSLETVSFCFKHKVALGRNCRSCGRDSVALQGFSRPGFCPRCFAWLGLDSSEARDKVAADHPMLRVAVSTSELVANLAKIDKFQGENVVQRNLKRLIEIAAHGNQSAFFKAYGSPSQAAMVSRKLPTLKMVVSLSVKLRVPATVFFNPNEDECDSIWQSAADRMEDAFLRSIRTRGKTISYLRDSLSVWSPPSLNDVAEDLGYRSTIPLYRANRDLATRVRLRHLKHSKAAPKHASNRPTPEAIREALENALLEEEPRSVADIAKDLGFFNRSDIVNSQPELCEAITKKRRLKRDADLKHQEKIILSALEEDPVPSLSELRRRLGLKCFNTITDRFPELSGALVQRRKDQRSARIASIRAALEARLQRPNFLWKDAFEATGMKRSSIEAQFPDLVPLIESKNKESRQRQSVQFSILAKKNVRLAVQQLVNRGIEPSINLVWDAIPRLPQHGKTMVESILREIRMEGNGALSHNPLETAE